jgi:hypothetical protein
MGPLAGQRVAGDPASKYPARWKRTEEAREFIDSLMRNINVDNNTLGSPGAAGV